jgi:hypothetical protein
LAIARRHGFGQVERNSLSLLGEHHGAPD